MQFRLREHLQSKLDSYNYLTLHRVPGPRSIFYFLPVFITFASLLVPPSRLSFRNLQHAVLPITLAIQYLVWQRDQSFDVISMQTCLTSFALLGWYDVRNNFKRITYSKSGRKEGSYPERLFERIEWIGTLIVSIRFSDYLIQDRVHDAKQRQRKVSVTFASYFKRTLVRAILSLSFLDVTSYLIQDTAYFSCLLGKGRTCDSTFRSLFTDGLIIFFHVYAAASCLLAYLPTLILLLVLAPFPSLRYHPSISPVVIDDIFGPISSIWQVQTRGWGLRAFWGSFWHQNLRYVTATPGLALAATLHVSRRSLAWYTIVTGTAFFWSGCIHAGMVPPYPLGTAWSSTSLRLRIASFFWLQPLGIFIEGLVDSTRASPPKTLSQNGVQADKKAAKTSLQQILAFAWTASFILVSLWMTVLPVGRELGWWHLHPIPFSLTRSLVKLYCRRTS